MVTIRSGRIFLMNGTETVLSRYGHENITLDCDRHTVEITNTSSRTFRNGPNLYTELKADLDIALENGTTCKKRLVLKIYIFHVTKK
jgi:hypothetical protein